MFLTQVTEGMVVPCSVIKEKNKFEGKRVQLDVPLGSQSCSIRQLKILSGVQECGLE